MYESFEADIYRAPASELEYINYSKNVIEEALTIKIDKITRSHLEKPFSKISSIHFAHSDLKIKHQTPLQILKYFIFKNRFINPA